MGLSRQRDVFTLTAPKRNRGKQDQQEEHDTAADPLARSNLHRRCRRKQY